MKMIVKKERTQRKLIKNVHMYILPTEARAMTCYKTDPSLREDAP